MRERDQHAAKKWILDEQRRKQKGKVDFRMNSSEINAKRGFLEEHNGINAKKWNLMNGSESDAKSRLFVNLRVCV